MLTVTNTVQQLYLPCCRRRFLSHCRNARRRLWGAWGQPACHCLLECLLLYFDVTPFPIRVCTTCRAEDHLWCPSHLLSLRDIRSALHLPSVDYWAECECLVKQTEDLKFQRLVFFWAMLMWTVRSVLQQISSSIKDSLENEVIRYNFKSSFFDIFVSGSIQVCSHLILR